MLVLTDTQESPLVAQFLDKKGKPAKIDGAPVYATSDPNIAVVVPDPADPTNPFAAVVRAVDLGTGQVSCTADADLGEGTRPVVLTLDIQVVPGEAVAGTISAGTPVEQAAS